MKKFSIILLILISCLFFKHSYTIKTNAENVLVNINTLYPNNVNDYQDLSDISNVAISENYIAYSLSTSKLSIFDKTTKNTIDINTFSNILDLKYISNDNLLLINYDDSLKTGKIYLITIDNSIPTISEIKNIDISNLVTIDIFNSNNKTLIGLIKSNNTQDNSFELYELDSSKPTNSAVKIDNFTNSILNTAYLIALDEEGNQYIVFRNSESQPRLITREYKSESNISPVAIIDNIQILDYYNNNDNKFLLAFTKENLYLLDLNTPSTVIDLVTNLDISDIDVSNNLIYISDHKQKIVKSFSLDTTTSTKLKENPVIISGAHNSLGRFNSVSDIFIQGDELYISDTNNDRIQIINKTNLSTDPQIIDGFGVDSLPHSALIDSQQNLYFSINNSNTTSSEIIKRSYSEEDSEYKFVNYKTYNNNNNLGYISDMSVTKNNDVYFIDYTNNKLLTINQSTGIQDKLTFEFTTNKNTKIEYLREYDLFVILNNNNLYLLNYKQLDSENNPIINTLTLDSYNVKDITCNTNSILALTDEKIILVTINNSDMQISEKQLQNDTFSNLSCISLDIVTQTIYAFDESRQCIVYFNSYITEYPFNFDNVDKTNLLNKNYSPFAIEIKNNGIITDLPYSLGNQYTNIANCIGIEAYNDYFRVIFNDNNELKSGFIKITDATIITHNTTEKLKVITTNQKVPVYKYPTILKYNSQAIITSYIPIGTHIEISYNPFPIKIDTKIFYAYEINGYIGYIFNADVVLDDITNITNLQTDNASIKTSDDKIILYGEDKESIITILYSKDRIYVENYDKNSEYTLVVYKTEKLEVLKGYIKTEYIEMDKLNNSKIVLIFIIILSIILLIIILISYIVIKKKKTI